MAMEETASRAASAEGRRVGDMGIFINGEWGSAASGETFEVVDPATGEVIGTVPRCGADDVDRAAREALPAWRETPAFARGWGSGKIEISADRK